MSYKISSALRACLLLIVLSAGFMPDAQASVTNFPTESHFATGRWVKIDYSGTGIFEITYESLREMGFADPSKVGVFGRGGELQPEQFTDASGNALYDTSLTPVAVLHAADKILFYGQGPAVIRQCVENVNSPTRQQFELKSHNTYTTHGSYYLTDSRQVYTPETASGPLNMTKPIYTKGWSVMYHELDALSANPISRQFLGENLKTDTPLSFPYSFPGAEPGSDAFVDLHVAHYPGSGTSSVKARLTSGANATDGTITLMPLAEHGLYAGSSRPYFRTSLPGAEGTFTLSFSGNSAWAYLDYFILAGRTNLDFAGGRNQLTVYASDFSFDTYSLILYTSVPDDLVVWDVANPHDVFTLPYIPENGNAYARYLRDSKPEGVLTAFSPSRPQMQITSWSEVTPTSLHRLGLNSVPHLLIITLPEFREAAERIAALHSRMEGIETAIVYSDDVVQEFSAGVPDPMAYRALAKMLYDRDNPDARRLKNILLLGPCHRDHRSIVAEHPVGNLISNQSYLADNVDNSFLLTDWYGMMADHTDYTPANAAELLAQVPLDLGVGHIPANNAAEAMAYVQKLEEYYADDSAAIWLGEANYVADSADDNQHQNQMDAVHHDMMNISDYAFTGNKLYNNLYPDRGTTAAFKRNMTQGSLFSYYLGHSDPNNLSGEFWNPNDTRELSNNRYGLMTFASCTVTAFDSGERGIGEAMVMKPDGGLVAGFMTTRNCYSFSNFELMLNFQHACMMTDLSENATLLEAPRTLGEVYTIAKNGYTSSSNKMAYHLVGDPAVVLPVATASVKAVIDGSTSGNVTVYPHSELSVSGTIVDRKGAQLPDFNGTLVAKVYNAPKVRPTAPRKGGEVKNIEIDEAPLGIYTFKVANGRFDGKVMLPTDIAPCDSAMATIRLTAFDPGTRRGAMGMRRLDVQPYDDAHAVASDLPPVIERMYVNSPDYPEGHVVPPTFTLYADISDDHAVMPQSVDGFTALSLTVDGIRMLTDINVHSTQDADSRRLQIHYPMTLTPGVHTLLLEARDAEGQRVRRSLTVNVGDTELHGALTVPSEPARDSATFTFTPAGDMPDTPTLTLVIVDASGHEVTTIPMTDVTLNWDLCDASGKRVSPGIYSAICRISTPALGQGATAPCHLVVF